MAIEKNIACIGAGYWGKNLIRNFSEIGALAAICETDAARCKEFAQKYPDVGLSGSIQGVLADSKIRAVVIATPAATHAALVRQALLAGKDVFVEKPLALSLEEGAPLVELARTKGRILMVGHLLWYHPAVLKLSELVKSGDLGRIQYIYSNRLNLGKIRAEENILWSFAPHDISVILGLLGESPDRCEARGGNFLHDKIADVTVSLLSFPSGAKAHIFVSWLHPFKDQKLVVVGDRKMAVFNDVLSEDKLLLYTNPIKWKNNQPVADKSEGIPVPVDKTEPLKTECLHFLECVDKRIPPRTDGDEALRVLSVLQDCQKSLDSDGRPQDAAPSNGAKPRYFVHKTACIDDGVEIGDDTMIWNFSHVLKNSRLGRKCRIGQNVSIGPDVSIGENVKIQNNVSVYKGVTLEDNVFCGPSMVFTNVYNPRSEILRMEELRKTLVREGASLGANCTILCGITVGRYAFIGAGAVVLKDVPDYALIVGNPGRLKGWMCVCGERIDFIGSEGAGSCKGCRRSYMKNGAEVKIQ